MSQISPLLIKKKQISSTHRHSLTWCRKFSIREDKTQICSPKTKRSPLAVVKTSIAKKVRTPSKAVGNSLHERITQICFQSSKLQTVSTNTNTLPQTGQNLFFVSKTLQTVPLAVEKTSKTKAVKSRQNQSKRVNTVPLAIIQNRKKVRFFKAAEKHFPKLVKSCRNSSEAVSNGKCKKQFRSLFAVHQKHQNLSRASSFK